MIDSYGRNIHYARISITDLCNLRCKYCMPEEGITKKDCGDILRLEEYVVLAKALVELGVDKIRLSGGEPLVRKGVVHLVEEIAELPGLQDLAMTTNGTLLSRYAEDLKNAGLKRINISIDSLNPEKYKEITRGGDLSLTLEGLHKALDLNFERIKLNVVLIKDFNDTEIEQFVNMTLKYPVDVRFIELMPFVGQQDLALGSFLPGQAVLDRCKNLKWVQKKDPAEVANYYQLPNAKGRVGLIEPLSHQFCGACNRLRITADGHLLTCLHSRTEVDLRESLSNSEQLKSMIEHAIREKPHTHHLLEGILMERDMGKIGG